MGARALIWLTVAGALAGCGLFGGDPQPSGREEALEKAREEAEEHADARFLAAYGGTFFRVNVRYVPMLDESVIAVREGMGEAQDEGWQIVTVRPSIDLEPGTNFADPVFETVAVAIAREVQGIDGICKGGQAMRVSTDGEGDVRTLYRSNRQVWVVFALCPEQVGG